MAMAAAMVEWVRGVRQRGRCSCPASHAPASATQSGAASMSLQGWASARQRERTSPANRVQTPFQSCVGCPVLLLATERTGMAHNSLPRQPPAPSFRPP